MKNDGITSADIRLVQTLLSTRVVDEDLSEMVHTHLLGVYRQALAGETDATRELMRLLVATYTVGNSALALAANRDPAQALEIAADYHAGSEDEA
ncbi:MAG TPA: hypothetical protein H9755_01210 [Candidatus Dietzia intestinigallinarum]|nr:hypothetical protein [Candidatus Dietzia intestinipullorum]HJC58940.1 hypothetical protein [Candidatus Dietzia intestinigallinarum]